MHNTLAIEAHMEAPKRPTCEAFAIERVGPQVVAGPIMVVDERRSGAVGDPVLPCALLYVLVLYA